MPRIRLASALLVPEPQAREIDGLRRALGDDLDKVAPHLTLVPPVNVRVEDVNSVLATLRTAAAVCAEPIAVRLGPPVTFLPVNPVVYLQVAGDVDAVRSLRDAVFVPPLARTLSYDFVPHVTVAETSTPERIDAALVAMRDYAVDVTFTAVQLLQESDRCWRPIAEARFEAPLVVGRGGVETEITRSAVADPEVLAFLGEEAVVAEQVVVARREGAVVAVALASATGEFARVDGDPDLERHLLKMAEAPR